MKKILVFTLLILLASSEVAAQRRNGIIHKRWDSEGFLTISFGPNYAFADPDCSKALLGPVLNQNILQNQDISIGFRQQFSEKYGYHAFMSYDTYTGSDIKNLTRNMSFKSSAFQMSVVGEYAYNFSKKYRKWKINSIYGFAGVGLIYNNADLNYDRTKGFIGYTYKETDLKPTIPYGIGYRYILLQEGLTFGVEIISRLTFSDYLDGFAPPSRSSKSNDMFQGFRFTASKRIFSN